MKDLIKKDNNLKPLKIGEIVKGKVIAKEKGSLFLDLGPFGTGIIYGKEFLEAKDSLKEIKIGETIFAKIIGPEEGKNEEGYLELSVAQAGKEIAWEQLKEKKEKGEMISVKILGANKGGLLTEFLGIPAFLPTSQLSTAHYPRVEGGQTAEIVRKLQKFIGKELLVQILDLDPKTEKLILSEKIKEVEKIKEILKNYEVGEVVEGKITGILDFGAFLEFPVKIPNSEIPTLEGLIHISELDWQIIEDPSEIVKVGENVKAKIIDISNDKIFLSLKALKKDPWQDIEKKYKKGDIVKGKVIKFNPFGAFVEIEPKIQALCHISEFGSEKKMEEKLKIGESYNFQILEISPLEHKMNLRLIESLESLNEIPIKESVLEQN